MTMNIKYRPIKAFLFAVDTGSFTHAASQLGVTQSSFTAMIQVLEDTLGVRLFERSTRAIALTSAGENFLSRVRRPLADIEDAYRSVQDNAATQRDTVILGALPSTGALIAPALELLHKTLPALRARVSVAYNDDLQLMLRTNQIECAVSTLQTPAQDLEFQPLIEDCTCVVVRADHPLAARKHLTWDDLVDQEMILPARGAARTQFDGAWQLRTASPSSPPRYEVSHVVMATAFVRHGLGITLLPRLMLPELNLHGLVVRRLGVSSALRCIGIVHRHDRSLKPAAQRFVECLSNLVPQIESMLHGFESDESSSNAAMIQSESGRRSGRAPGWQARGVNRG
jgi:DNA-binding transcriptional LysR family regulator